MLAIIIIILHTIDHEVSSPTNELRYLQYTSAFQKFVFKNVDPIKLPSFPSRSCGRVLTSAENLKKIEQKEKEKKEKEQKIMRQGINT